ncbi:MerR family transcriptional regulator [Tabrizicola sp.]|uniref:MerR family transcriptional regulator n=1 Tax=Tabrizicola sp. TaxID=2005166 RepID=UPI0025FD4E17|nr:MerR family transcriptional regulator [Tabrizicola sp.]
MDKSPDAFRTISEVAESLDTPAHVLRFWESRFPQIKPVKRAGGRRYYRPSDVALLTGIKRLLHDEGLTIRGVQKILRDQGVRHVAGLTDDSVSVEDLIAPPAAAVEAPEIEVPEAGFIAIDDPEPEAVSAPPSRPARAPVEQSTLPLFDQAFDAPPALARTMPPKKPTLRTDTTFASMIRTLPRNSGSGNRRELAEIARRLAALRARLAARAEGGIG